jgi:hypothetical protein
MNGQFDLGAISPIRYFFGIAAVVGLLLGFTSGEDEGSALGPRLLQWQLQALGIMGLLVLTHITLLRWRWFERRNPWLQLAASGITASLLFSPVGVGIDAWLAGEMVGPGQRLSETVDEFSGLAPPAMVCWLAINAPWLLGFRVERQELSPAVAASNEGGVAAEKLQVTQPDFLKLLPADLRGPVIYLQAELHYISVVTVHGRGLILYNLKDAVDELARSGSEGVQSHRSFWVAMQYVDALEKKGRQGVLRLTNGDRVPVSRRNMDQVKASLGT